jgi:hypothetical protein
MLFCSLTPLHAMICGPHSAHAAAPLISANASIGVRDAALINPLSLPSPHRTSLLCLPPLSPPLIDQAVVRSHVRQRGWAPSTERNRHFSCRLVELHPSYLKMHQTPYSSNRALLFMISGCLSWGRHEQSITARYHSDRRLMACLDFTSPHPHLFRIQSRPAAGRIPTFAMALTSIIIFCRYKAFRF